MKNYASFYEKISQPIRQSPMALSVLRGCNRSITIFMYMVYPLFLLHMAWLSRARLMLCILVPGLSFLLVTGLRKWLNQPRPYEAWPISPLLTKDTVGQSMPSRHVFSATMIAMCVLSTNAFQGGLLLLLTALLAVCRVLGGVHYPKDVLVAMAIGLGAGSLLFL